MTALAFYCSRGGDEDYCENIATNRATTITTFLCITLLLSACGLSDEEKAALAEKQRVECLDKICPGDTEPTRDYKSEVVFKVNGQWFVMPKEYGSPNFGALGFTWPSRTPLAADRTPPEKKTSGDGYDYSIEIFLRSNSIPSAPHGYALIQLAEKKGWVAARKTLRSGLDQIQMKHVIGPQEQYIDHVTYYVATELTGLDGLPPVATCNHDNVNNSGGTGFIWRPGIWVGTRMNQKHCADWPEVYQETMRVLSLLLEVK